MASARQGLAEEVASLLRAPGMVLVSGPPGSGRSTVLHDVAQRLAGAGVAPARITGRDAVDGIPLAPAAPLITALGLADRAAIEIYSLLPRLLHERGSALLIDDIEAADHATGVLAAQCVRAQVPVLMTGEGDLPGVLRDLIEVPLHRRALIPLSVEEIASIAEADGEKPLDVPSLARLVRAGRGLPGRVTELLAAGAPGAALTPGGRRLGPGVLTEPLRTEVESLLARCDEAVRAVVDVVCAVGRLPEQVVDPVAADQAVGCGLLRLDADDSGLLLPADDVVRAVVVERLGSAARRRLTSTAQREIARTDPADLEPAGRAIGAVLDLAHGVPVPDPALREAAREELRRHRPQDALTLLEALPAASTDAEVLLLRGRARAAAGDAVGAAADLREAAVSADGDLLAHVGRALGVVLAVDLEDPAAAVVEVGALVDRAPEDLAPVLEVDLVKWRLMAGAPSDRAVLPRAAQQALDDADRIGVALIEAMVAALDGPTARAEEIVREVLPLAEQVPAAPPHSADLLALSGYLAAVFAGDLTAGDARATAGYEQAVAAQHPAVGMWEYARAEFDLHRGLLGSAATRALRASYHLAWRDFTGLLPTVRALLAALEARHGRVGAAHDLAATLSPEAREDPKVALHLARVAAESARARRPEAAAAMLRTAADRAAEQSHTHLALLAHDEALMLAPRGPDAAELAALLAREAGRSPLVAALAARAAALVSDGPDNAAALETAARTLADLGLLGRAAHALEIAATRHRERGAREAATRCEEACASLRGRDRLWPVVGAGVVLSPRETEIATLAVAGARSRDIAERLGLSVRTVDNHLARIYTKLGVRGRDELAVVLDGVGPTRRQVPE